MLHKKGELKSSKRIEEMKNQLDTELSNLVSSLKLKIEGGEQENTDDDW